MALPIVAIVGRPNVGKSTLFNRIIKKRQAIVDDLPGVTRDRHYALTDWAGQSFVLVDTGGYLPQSSDEMEMAIREQVEIAIDEADLILHLVDRATGITDLDTDIAEKLKRSNKTVMLLVNKVDNENMETDIYQFYNLGMGDPVAISALQGRTIGDMLDRLNLQLKSVTTPKVEDGIKLAIVGRENVGKSSFVNTLIGQTRAIVTTAPGTTRDPIDSPLKYKQKKYLLIDTAGLKRKAKVKENVLFYSQLRTLRSIQRADVVIYFMDATTGPTRQDLRMLHEAVQQRKGMVIAVNKWDLVPKDEHTLFEWEQALKQRLGTFSFIPIVFTSVLEKKRLLKLLDVATHVYQEMHKYLKTSELNNLVLPILNQTTPPAVQGQEVKINYVTQVKSNPPVIAFFCNFPELIGASYKRFLEKKLREIWGFEGVPLTIVFKAKRKRAHVVKKSG